MIKKLEGLMCSPALGICNSVPDAMDGRPWGWTKVVCATGLRAGLLVPGLAIAGVRGKQLVLGAALSSTCITAFLFLFYGRDHAVTQALGSYRRSRPHAR